MMKMITADRKKDEADRKAKAQEDMKAKAAEILKKRKGPPQEIPTRGSRRFWVDLTNDEPKTLDPNRKTF